MLLSRVVLVGAAILIQILALVIVIWRFSNYFVYFYAVCALLSILVVMGIVNGKSNHAYKLAWIIQILMFPIFGGLFYLMFGGNKSSKRNKRKMKEIANKMQNNLAQDQAILKQLEQEDRSAANQAKYIVKYSACPVYTN